MIVSHIRNDDTKKIIPDLVTTGWLREPTNLVVIFRVRLDPRAPCRPQNCSAPHSPAAMKQTFLYKKLIRKDGGFSKDEVFRKMKFFER
jgi:hypothetical protein